MQWFAMSKVTAMIAVAAVAVSAQAGDALYFKNATVETTTTQRQLEGKFLSKGESYYVVQFKNRIETEDRKNILSLGGKIVRYVPDDALIVRATSKAIQNISRSSTSLQTILPYASDWKTSEAFAPASVFNAQANEEMIVRLFPLEEGAAAAKKISAIKGASVVSVSGRTVIVRAERAAVDAIAKISAVEWVEPNAKMVPMVVRMLEENADQPPAGQGDYTDLTGQEPGTKLMNFDSAWDRGFTGRGQVVSMADTGLDNGDVNTIHRDFHSRIPAGFHFGMFSKGWEDPMGHGTHVAGSVMGNGAGSGQKIRGGAYEAQIVPQGLWSPMMGGLSLPSRLGDLFTKAYESGARVHTNSWGKAADFGAYDSFAQQVDEYMAAHPDMLVIFAAGNSGVDADRDGRVDPNSVGSPGTAKNVLTVGASKNLVLKGGLQVALKETRLKESWPTEPLASSRMSENAQGLAAFSSRGPTKDGRLKPEIVAPGTNILSNKSHTPTAELLWGPYNADYVYSGGTSMSTPLTAGAAAVTRQYLIEDRKVANPSAALVKAVLMHTAFDLFPGQFGEVGQARGQELVKRRPNTDEGYGRVDVDSATKLDGAMIIDETKGLAMNEAHTYTVNVNGSSKLTATLVYTDAPAAASAAKALVNDLDLVVVDGSGRETTMNDRVNNNEIVEMNVQAGAYTIKVKGTNVPQGITAGKQPYALVVTAK